MVRSLMGYQSNPWDDQGTGAIEQDAPTGDFTETPDEVEEFLQDRV